MKNNILFTILWVLSILFVFTDLSFSQSTIIRLHTNDNTSSFNVTQSDSTHIFRLFGDGGFYIGGTVGSGSIPTTGKGARLMWYPKKAAFRAGFVSGTIWDDSNIGDYSTAVGGFTTASGASSTAMGYSTEANGDYSTAMGFNTTASGEASTAMGYETVASGKYSTAMGSQTEASGDYSTAMGWQTSVSGPISTAMGYKTTASGSSSTAMGGETTASGTGSIAMGYNTIAGGEFSTATGTGTEASGNYSTAMGTSVSTNFKEGSFIIGDYSTSPATKSSRDNQMTMRFAGGYRLFTNSSATIGVSLGENDNSWSSISDSTKKENFLDANGEYFLHNLLKLRLGSWNYKSQNPKEFRHYGPMAQEIFHYFGNDKYGTIGNDTTLSTADMDGIMMICLQALTKRTEKMKEKISSLKVKLASQKSMNSAQKVKLSVHGDAIEELRDELLEMKKVVNNFGNYPESFSEVKLILE